MSFRLRLRRSQRLGAADVAAALKAGRPLRAAGLALYRRPNGLPIARLALIVPKKLVPTAVGRNRIRRLIREAFRQTQEQLGGVDIVVRLTGKPGEADLCLDDIQMLLRRCQET